MLSSLLVVVICAIVVDGWRRKTMPIEQPRYVRDDPPFVMRRIADAYPVATECTDGHASAEIAPCQLRPACFVIEVIAAGNIHHSGTISVASIRPSSQV